jgi:transcriptional regulator with XRE-family HTH domain
MRKYTETLPGIIESSGLNLNQISKVSGISNAYLTKLVKGHINKPGKDKIASILLALNHSVTGDQFHSWRIRLHAPQ